MKLKLKPQPIIVSISKLESWEDNPRNATDEDLKRLKKQITELGDYKPLLCCKNKNHYTVLGGNMRLRAYKELGYKKVWIMIVNATTKARMLKYSLSDNDRVGYYDDTKLGELLEEVADDIELEIFKVDVAVPDINLNDIIQIDKKLSSGEMRKQGIFKDTVERTLNLGFTFTNAEEFDTVKKILKIRKNCNVTDGKILYAKLKNS